MVLRDALYGLRRFDEFQRSLGIATNTLTRRLTDLVTASLLEHRPYQSNPPRFEYLLTEVGRDLRPVILTLMAWGAKLSPPAPPCSTCISCALPSTLTVKTRQ
ncbi:helix-turn-helix domain-containing protein [Pseudomonas sp. CK-NBRI-02]|nr:helix-turn-helix domain-containing protein [Pseudomonas sp. CK-NBRI-02]